MKEFIKNILKNQEDSDRIIELYSELWKIEPNNAIKILFFILDRKHINNKKVFKTLFEWVRKNHPETFYVNLSHIVGVPNSKTLPKDLQERMLEEDIKKHNTILDEFVCKDYHQSFQESMISTTKFKLIESLGMTKYTDWSFMRELYYEYKDIDNKAKLIILNTFDKQITNDKLNRVYSEALVELKKDICMSELSRYNDYNQGDCKSEINKKEHSDYFERYAFIFRH